FVQAAITALINGAPATLDTLKEIAAAINNDPKFSTTINNALSGKQPLDETLTHLSGKDVAGLLAYLGLGEGSALPVGVPVPWPLPNPPQGWLKYNGAPFDKNIYPKLGAVYPAGVLPDLRGEFIRGWDDGRGVDAGRIILAQQGDAIRNITGGVQGRNAATSARLFNAGATGAFRTDGEFGSYAAQVDVAIGATDDRFAALFFDASLMVPTANENRPRNLSFNYIVRAM
ncbi:phage tail protein, partial [Escherichia coli]|nr:phage tail protein [Escherichia coli]